MQSRPVSASKLILVLALALALSLKLLQTFAFNLDVLAQMHCFAAAQPVETCTPGDSFLAADHHHSRREYITGVLQIAQGHHQQAKGRLQLAALSDDTGLARFELGSVDQLEGDTAEAIAIWRTVPNAWQYFLTLGETQLNKGEAELAVASFVCSTQIAPDQFRPWLRQAQTKYLIGDLRGSESAYRRAASLDPKSWEAVYGLATVLLDVGSYAEAEQSFHAALSLSGDALYTFLGLGSALRLAGKYDEAEAVYREAGSLFPQSALPLLYLGNNAVDRGDFQAAIRWLTSAQSVADTSAARYFLAISYSALCDLKLAQGQREALRSSTHADAPAWASRLEESLTRYSARCPG